MAAGTPVSGRFDRLKEVSRDTLSWRQSLTQDVKSKLYYRLSSKMEVSDRGLQKQTQWNTVVECSVEICASWCKGRTEPS